MTIPSTPAWGNGVGAPCPALSAADLDVAGVQAITSAAAIDALLAGHAAGTAPLQVAQLTCLRARHRQLAAESRLTAANRVQPPSQPRPKPQPRRPTGPACPRPADPGRVTAGDKVKGLTRLYAAQLARRTSLSPPAVAAYGYLLTFATDGRVTATTTQIGRAIARSKQTASRAVAELETAGLVTTARHGTPGGTPAEAVSVYRVQLPPEVHPLDPTITTES